MVEDENYIKEGSIQPQSVFCFRRVSCDTNIGPRIQSRVKSYTHPDQNIPPRFSTMSSTYQVLIEDIVEEIVDPIEEDSTDLEEDLNDIVNMCP